MQERELARTLLVQACEESDPTERFLPERERRRATHQAEQATGASDSPETIQAFVAHRAELLADGLEARHPALGAGRAVARLHVPALAALLLGLLGGLAADALGSQRRINLLSFPLLGLILWNLAVYAALTAGRLWPRDRERFRGAGFAGSLVRLGSWLVSPERRWVRGGPVETTRWIADSLRSFLGLWLERAGPLLRLRMRRLLHLAALGFGIGVVLSMYVGGFAFAYRASWESTFLDAEAVRRLLGAVLGPAAAVLGTPLPDAAGLAALRAPAHGDAASWIHLWAVTAAFLIGIPRVALAAAAGWKERRARGSLGVAQDSPYVLRLLAPQRGGGTSVHVLPYSYQPTEAAVRKLRALLLDLHGNRARVSMEAPMEYGAALDEGGLGLAGAPQESPGVGPCAVALFNLAQSPEQEVHGELLDALKQFVERRGSGATLLVLLDEEPYRARLGEAGDEGRLEERRRSWERLADTCDVDLVLLEASAKASPDSALGLARAALWPRCPEAAP